jgi:hypothetical protein
MLGKSTNLLTFKKDSTAESAEKITFTDDDIERIFFYFPKLKDIYKQKVPKDMTKKKFWENFWKD